MKGEILLRRVFKCNHYQLFAASKTKPNNPRDLQQVLADNFGPSQVKKYEMDNMYLEIRYHKETNTAVVAEYAKYAPDSNIIQAIGTKENIKKLREGLIQKIESLRI